ncbi:MULTISPECIES: hypothetical protein [Klebsiella pneumoniae complex]|uniref:hypothetical protein n=1 Tax=Klebsiella pneumoniae complex TaxID=3390273 RepID=UPI001905EFBC|nr:MULTISPECIES: hypothetical protein [Klebsiella]MBK1448911.1 hypothetical protein [Klebsiella variicola]CAH3279923.1 hypothetical protein AH0331V1_1765 [Klebsiella pneumoniae]HBU8938106.1 hypothetical protein [Klebsiella pneumoniae]HCB2062863.1 hypothetical protein [Klebsiella pneumoniae]
MKVKTYSVNTFDAWLQTEGDDTTGSYVKYEDYAALAAECAALKSAIEFAEPWLPTCDEELLHRIEIAKQTPATDRIVAEAEARGVEKAIAHLEKKFSNIGVQIMNLQWLADSLREGAK